MIPTFLSEQRSVQLAFLLPFLSRTELQLPWSPPIPHEYVCVPHLLSIKSSLPTSAVFKFSPPDFFVGKAKIFFFYYTVKRNVRTLSIYLF
jgi:hypothetical protein